MKMMQYLSLMTMMLWLALMKMMQWLVLAPHSRNVLGSGPGSHCVESVLLVFVWVFLQVFLPQFPSTVQGRADLADWRVCVCVQSGFMGI